MSEDRIVCRNGEYIRMTEKELEGFLEAAFRSATELALIELGVKDDSVVTEIGCEAGFGHDHITATVKLSDGRQASASASIWPDARPN